MRRAGVDGGGGGRRDFSPCFTLVGVVVGFGSDDRFGAGAVGVVVELGFPRRRRVTGMKAEVAEA